jgi:hypothetical protein
LTQLADSLNRSSLVQRQLALSEQVNQHPLTQTKKKLEEEKTLQGKVEDSAPSVLQKLPAPNHTGLPDDLKSGVESLSGISLENVRVHFNSSQPAQLNALAFTQGTDIHVAPGQERHLAHEAWHVVQQAQGRVRPTLQMKNGVPVNDDRGLEHEADVMGAKALRTKDQPLTLDSSSPAAGSGRQAVQRMALYHGTTIEDAHLVVNKIDPSKGGGEFGLGFYTVFSLAQAKHIAMYYWDKEKKYNKAKTGVAVVKISIPDNWWEQLMKAADDRYNVVHKNAGEWFNAETDPREGRNADEQLDEGEELAERDDKLWWMPRNDEELSYQEKDDREDDLRKDVIVGAIKDPQTPYLQVVFGTESADYLLQSAETTKQIVWQQAHAGVFGSGQNGYAGAKLQGVEELGSLVQTDTFKANKFRAEAKDHGNPGSRLSFINNLLGGMEDKYISQEVAQVLQELGIPGKDKAEKLFNYYNKGIPKI